MSYWDNAEKNKAIAAAHTAEMSSKYSKEIRECINKTWVYDSSLYSPASSPIKGFKGDIVVEATDSVSAIFSINSLSTGKTAVLNFASYTEPGGKFIEGSTAQEECLCHSSFLYNVLKEKTEFYAENVKNKNRALYTNRALYSPGVIFIKNEKTTIVDVITCAAPNYKAASKYCKVTKQENREALESRIGFVLDIAQMERVDNLILEAFGCGVFGQNAKEVSMIFKEKLQSGKYYYKKVVFAIPGGLNLKLFQETFMV